MSTATALGAVWELDNKVAVTAARNLASPTQPIWPEGGSSESMSASGTHTRRPGEPSSTVTVMVDLTPLAYGAGPVGRHTPQPQRGRPAGLAE